MSVGDKLDLNEQLRAFEEFAAGAVSLSDIVEKAREVREQAFLSGKGNEQRDLDGLTVGSPALDDASGVAVGSS